MGRALYERLDDLFDFDARLTRILMSLRRGSTRTTNKLPEDIIDPYVVGAHRLNRQNITIKQQQEHEEDEENEEEEEEDKEEEERCMREMKRYYVRRAQNLS